MGFFVKMKISGFFLLFSYYELCMEILSSVRKMEDNIQRLKRVRESSKALSSMTQSATAGSTEMTDDNKIRKQIQHDVDAFISEVIFSIVYELFFYSFFYLA